jgi:2-succinyl-5-enolpyruvyl-6-hydroxy-3-cyclohexene-1-carboxylate synthase
MTNLFLQVNALDLFLSLEDYLDIPRKSAWLDDWKRLEVRCWSELSRAMNRMDFDGAYVADLMDLLPAGSAIMAGNSLPIRHVDQFARPQMKPIHVYANRGASGIDGIISTGLGITVQDRYPTTILTGDITFYHDSNGLLALRRMKHKGVTIIVLNNDGGGIFRRLPVAQFEPPFKDLFQVPHGLDLSSIARTYDLEYHRSRSREEMRALFSSESKHAIARLIEIRTDAENDYQIRSELESLVLQNLSLNWQ